MAKKEKIEKQGNDKILADLEAKYGVSRASIIKPEVVHSGSLQLDQALGCGGTPVGKLIEVFGPESSGKSTLILHQIAEFQKAFPERRVALLDFEHSFDLQYAHDGIGVDTDNLLIYQPDTMEQGYDLIIGLVESNLVSLVCLDSQTAAQPKAIVDGDISDATIGLAARINSKFCGKIKGLLDIHRCTLISISQTRTPIGSMTPGDISTGGNSYKFYSDQRWKVWKMNDKENSQNKTTVDIIKNKLSCPWGQAKFLIKWGSGISKLDEIIDYSIESGLIKQGGAWYTFREEKYQGLDNLKKFLEDNPEVVDYLEKEVLKSLKNTETKTQENVE